MVEKLQKFSGQRFTIRTYNDDTEAVNMTKIVFRILMAAGWVHLETSHIMAFRLVTGVSIEVAPSHATDFEPAAKALASALTAEGIDASETVNPGEEHDNHASMIHIRVGREPKK